MCQMWGVDLVGYPIKIAYTEEVAGSSPVPPTQKLLLVGGFLIKGYIWGGRRWSELRGGNLLQFVAIGCNYLDGSFSSVWSSLTPTGVTRSSISSAT
jgi:hypothetical protein